MTHWGTVVFVVDSTRADVSEARRAARAYVKRHCPWVREDDVLLVISELVGNAVRHTGGFWRLSLQARPYALVARVDDHSTRMPAPRVPDVTGSGGYGWHIARSLCGQLTVLPRRDGKTVEARWNRADAPPDPVPFEGAVPAPDATRFAHTARRVAA